MAIQSYVTHTDRYHEIPGCPRASPDAAEDESTCDGCPYNVLYPEEPYVGCHIYLDYTHYLTAIEILQAHAPEDYETLRVILERERNRPHNEGLTAEEAQQVLDMTDRWYALLGGEADLVQVLHGVEPFVRKSVETGMEVRILA